MCMVDVMLYLVDRGQFDEIMSMTAGGISSAMEVSSLRTSRPDADPRFHRDFDVDLEGEVLELIDGSADLEGGEKLSQSIGDASMELRLLMAKWCSSAQWRCWDARLFLYVDPLVLGPAISWQRGMVVVQRAPGADKQRGSGQTLVIFFPNSAKMWYHLENS